MARAVSRRDTGAQMISELIQQYITQFSYLAIFILIALTGTGFFPIPIEIVMLLAGYLSFKGIVGLPEAILIAFLGTIIADAACFHIGKHSGIGRLRFYARLLVGKGNLDWVRKLFKYYGTEVIFLTRFVPVVKFPVTMYAGHSGMPWIKYQIASSAGFLIWTIIVCVAGFSFSKYIDQLVNAVVDVRKTILIIMLVAFVLLVSFAAYRHLKKDIMKVLRI